MVVALSALEPDAQQELRGGLTLLLRGERGGVLALARTEEVHRRHGHGVAFSGEQLGGKEIIGLVGLDTLANKGMVGISGLLAQCLLATAQQIAPALRPEVYVLGRGQ